METLFFKLWSEPWFGNRKTLDSLDDIPSLSPCTGHVPSAINLESAFVIHEVGTTR